MAKKNYVAVGDGSLFGEYRSDGDVFEADPSEVKFLLMSGRVKEQKSPTRKSKPKVSAAPDTKAD